MSPRQHLAFLYDWPKDRFVFNFCKVASFSAKKERPPPIAQGFGTGVLTSTFAISIGETHDGAGKDGSRGKRKKRRRRFLYNIVNRQLVFAAG